MPPGTSALHHIAYWAPDMDAQAEQLFKLGYQLEWTPVVNGQTPATDGAFRGFAYFTSSGGSRIELQRAGDRPAMQRWLAGGELELNYPGGT